MVRFLHFSDLHLGSDYHGKPNPETGVNQRVHDFASRFDELIDFALAERIDLVVFAGDAFKNSHPIPTVQKMLAQRVRRLAKAGVHVFMLAGNHDLPRMETGATAFSVYPALEVDNVTVAEQSGIYAVPLASGETVQIVAFPHIWRSAFTKHVEKGATPGDIDRAIERMVAGRINDMAADLNPSLPSILTAHVHVTKAKVSTAQDLYGLSESEFLLSTIAHKSFPYVALGHIHKQQALSDDWRGGTFAAYSGSLDRVDFGEESEEKGFYEAELDGNRLVKEPVFHRVNARAFLTVKATVDSADPTGSVLAAIAAEPVAGAVVRVQVRAPRDLFEEVDQRKVREALAAAYDSRVQAVYPEESITAGVRDPRFAERMSEAQALEEWVRGDAKLAEDAGELLRLGRGVIDEVLAES